MMKKNKGFAVIVALFTMLILSVMGYFLLDYLGINNKRSQHQEIKVENSVKSSEGIVLRGCFKTSSAIITLTNTNDYKAVIREVTQMYNFGECTEMRKILQPNETLERRINQFRAWHIAILDDNLWAGTEIGFLTSECSASETKE